MAKTSPACEKGRDEELSTQSGTGARKYYLANDDPAARTGEGWFFGLRAFELRLGKTREMNGENFNVYYKEDFKFSHWTTNDYQLNVAS